MTMSLALSPNRSSPPLPVPVLIAASNPSLLDSLPPALSGSVPDIAISLCSTRDYAMEKLALARYQLVVTGVDFAEAENFALLRRHRDYQLYTPFIVTAEAGDRLLVTRAVEFGIDDIIVTPVDQVQAQDSLRRALWLYQMRVAMAQRKQTLEKLRRWRDIVPVKEPAGTVIDERMLDMKETLRAYERTIEQIETSLKYLTGVAESYETQAREKTAEHLNTFWRFGR